MKKTFMLNINVYVKKARRKVNICVVQCPFEKEEVNEKDLEIFKKEIQVLYWAFSKTRPLCAYDGELITEVEFEDE